MLWTCLNLGAKKVDKNMQQKNAVYKLLLTEARKREKLTTHLRNRVKRPNESLEMRYIRGLRMWVCFP